MPHAATLRRQGIKVIPKHCLNSFQDNASSHSKTMPHAAILHRQGIPLIPRQCFNSFQDNASCGYLAPPRHSIHSKTMPHAAILHRPGIPLIPRQCLNSFQDIDSIHSKTWPQRPQVIPRQCLMRLPCTAKVFHSFQDNAPTLSKTMLQVIPRQCFKSFQDIASIHPKALPDAGILCCREISTTPLPSTPPHACLLACWERETYILNIKVFLLFPTIKGRGSGMV